MKNFLFLFFLLLNLLFLSSCAKPKVVNIVQPKDEILNCEELNNAIAETHKIKRDAKYAKEGTGGNITRMMLFWPAWARTLHNADVAIIAANDRIFHLINIMKKKESEGAKSISSKMSNGSNFNNISQQLKDLKQMYDSGDLTLEEYTKAKKKLLD